MFCWFPMIPYYHLPWCCWESPFIARWKIRIVRAEKVLPSLECLPNKHKTLGFILSNTHRERKRVCVSWLHTDFSLNHCGLRGQSDHESFYKLDFQHVTKTLTWTNINSSQWFVFPAQNSLPTQEERSTYELTETVAACPRLHMVRHWEGKWT